MGCPPPDPALLDEFQDVLFVEKVHGAVDTLWNLVRELLLCIVGEVAADSKNEGRDIPWVIAPDLGIGHLEGIVELMNQLIDCRTHASRHISSLRLQPIVPEMPKRCEFGKRKVFPVLLDTLTVAHGGEAHLA